MTDRSVDDLMAFSMEQSVSWLDGLQESTVLNEYVCRKSN